MRGEAEQELPQSALYGITPACAGRSSGGLMPSAHMKDHPRVCGEKVTGKFLWTMGKGSPPRVRGEVRSAAFPPLPTGITPACAGRRKADSERQGESEDHPRVCGEKPIRTRICPARTGSPPRVRGEGTLDKVRPGGVRITPACAGRSCQNPQGDRKPKDHPRVCGEKHLGHPRKDGDQRITPACAGRRLKKSPI